MSVTGENLPAAAFAIPGDITMRTGGYIYERRLLEGLRARGHDVAHLVLGSGFPDPTPVEMAEAISTLAAVPAHRPVIVDGLVFGAIETEGLAQTRAPIIAMIHHPLALETGLERARAELLYRRERANLRLASHVLVPSPHTARILVERYGADPATITLAPPGVKRASGPRRHVPVGPPLILSVGLLHPRKGHDVLIAALARLPRHGTGAAWQAVIVGREHHPGERERLEGLVAALDLADRVRIAGEVSGEELAQLYRSAAVFALATRYEGYGMVFDEALVHGLPIVSCAVGAVPETVPGDAGILVPPDDAPALAGALAALLADAERRQSLGRAALTAGALRPRWEDTAAIAGEVIMRLARGQDALA